MKCVAQEIEYIVICIYLGKYGRPQRGRAPSQGMEAVTIQGRTDQASIKV